MVGDIPGSELWKLLAVAAMFILLLELVVSRWIARNRKIGAAVTIDFTSEGERITSFHDRAKELMASASGN
jgi:hypothetical protein